MSRDASQELRPVVIDRGFTRMAAGSVLYKSGETIVLCTASVDEKVPGWLEKQGTGWMTAEYNMLPGSTSPRKERERQKVDGRTTEIQRLIGRSLRAVADLAALGPRMITVDCDVLQADGGTRTAAITGGFIALVDAIHSVRERLPNPDRYPLRDSVAAISVGLVDGELRIDLNYELDVAAEVDLNVIMTGRGQFVERQGCGEEATFSEEQLAQLLSLGKRGIRQLTQFQRHALGSIWPWGREGTDG
ncbi:MAG: ribonuclease PH [Planctomycetota bacterium]